MHQGDAGSDAYDRDLALNILGKEHDALYEIEEAIRRVERGTYGLCEMSGEKIPKERLEAIPFCRLTVACQEKWEEKHGKNRYRREDEAGFSGLTL
jgi:RNA polymerase-binding transcription factor DksA